MKPARGFTLIEVLVALAILALTMLLAYRATAALTDSEMRLTDEAARWRSLDATLARIEGDLRQAIPRVVRFAGRPEPAWLAAVDPAGNTALAIARAGSEFVDEPGIAGQRIVYRVEGQTLQIVYWPELDNAADAEPVAYALLDNIARFRVDHLAAAGRIDRWPMQGEIDLPRGVRIELTLVGGETIERWIALQ
jgi:general secretion pathway protein J